MPTKHRRLPRTARARGVRGGLRGGSADFYSTGATAAPSEPAGRRRRRRLPPRTVRARGARGGLRGGPQTSTLWYTRSLARRMPCCTFAQESRACGPARRRRARGDEAPRRPERTSARRSRRGSGPADTARVSDETRLRPQHRRPQGVPVAAPGSPQGARPESCRTRDLPMDLTLAGTRLNCCAIHKLHRPNPRTNSPLEIYN